MQSGINQRDAYQNSSFKGINSYFDYLVMEKANQEGIPILIDNHYYADEYKMLGYDVLMASDNLRNDTYEEEGLEIMTEAEYEKKYSTEIQRIREEIEIDEINIVSLLDCENNCVLYDSDKKQGAVYVNLKNMSKSVLVRSLDIFPNNTVVDFGVGKIHIVGLANDGQVVSYINDDAVSKQDDFGQADITQFNNIVDVEAGWYHTLLLKSDGTVIAAGNNNHGQCDVESWSDIVSIEAKHNTSFGVKSDGSVVFTGDSDSFDVSRWEDIKEISFSGNIVMGLKSDGTVMISGEDWLSNRLVSSEQPLFKDIISIGTSNRFGAALDSSGEVHCFTLDSYFLFYSAFQSGVDDAVHIDESTIAAKCGEEIIYSHEPEEDMTWSEVLSLNAQALMEMQDQNIRVEILGDGTLKLERDVYVNKNGSLVLDRTEEQIMEYASKIVQVINAGRNSIYARCENDDILKVGQILGTGGGNKMCFDLIMYGKKFENPVKKIIATDSLLLILDEMGRLFIPDDIIESTFRDIPNLKYSENWYRYTSDPPFKIQSYYGYLDDEAIIKISWNEFKKYFSGEIPDFAELTEKTYSSGYKTLISDDRAYISFDHTHITDEGFREYESALLSLGFEIADMDIAEMEYEGENIVTTNYIFEHTISKMKLQVQYEAWEEIGNEISFGYYAQLSDEEKQPFIEEHYENLEALLEITVPRFVYGVFDYGYKDEYEEETIVTIRYYNVTEVEIAEYIDELVKSGFLVSDPRESYSGDIVYDISAQNEAILHLYYDNGDVSISYTQQKD